MNVIKCPSNNPKCRYRVDCDNRRKKTNEMSSLCPANKYVGDDLDNIYNILKCDRSNQSKTCPVVLCNYSKLAQQNNDIYKRNFPDCKMTPVKNYRGSFDICRQAIDLDKDNSDLKLNLTNKITRFQDISAPFVPGKGKGTEFLKNIDVDSELRRLNYNNTLCPTSKYKPIKCKNSNKCLEVKQKINCSGPEISNPFCENTRECVFNDSTKTYKTKCGQCPQIVDKHNIQLNGLHRNIPSDMVMGMVGSSSQLSANYSLCNFSNNKHSNCMDKKYFKQCDPPLQYRHPVPYQMENHIRQNRSLRVGPERKEHNCENIWNNLTRRVNI